MDKIKLAIVDDHALFRGGLTAIFQSFPHIEVVFEAENGQSLLDKLRQREEKPDVVLMDLYMPVMDGMVATEHLKSIYPQIKVLVLSMNDEEQFIIKMLDLGANGYLLKNASLEELLLAVETVMLKDYYFNDYVNKVMLKNIRDKKNYTKVSLNKQETLTKREVEALELICKGYSSVEIGEKLFISKRTVEFHRQNLLEKLAVKNTASLIVYAVQNGLVSL